MADLQCGAESMPTGTELCEFVSCEETTGKFNEPALRWVFECRSGENAGKQAKRVTGPSPAPDNACGQMVSWLLGRPFQRGQRCDTNELLNRKFMVTVAGGQIIKIKPVEENAES